MKEHNEAEAKRLVREARERTTVTLTPADRFPWEDEHGDGPFSPPDECRGCGEGIWPENRTIADGCPCNSSRGINHGLVPKNTCTCQECDPEQTGSTRYPWPASWRALLEQDHLRAMADALEAATAEVERLRKQCEHEQLDGANGDKSRRCEARAERDRYHVALTKISAIRDSIVGMQGFNFSEHAYPLVAALDEAGFKGAGYEIARANLGTLIEQRNRAEAERDQARAERDVWSGKACEEEQRDGNGPCGACRHCLPGLLKEARTEAERYLTDGKALHREIEKVARALNEIGWPSENVSTAARACKALRMLAEVRDRARATQLTQAEAESLRTARDVASDSDILEWDSYDEKMCAITVLDRFIAASKGDA